MAPSGSTISKFEKFPADAKYLFLETSPAATISRLRSAYLSTLLDRCIMTGLLTTVVFATLAHGAVEPWSVGLFELILIVILALWLAKAVVDRYLEITIPPIAFPLGTLLLLGIAQSVALTGNSGQRVSLSMDVEATRHAVLILFFLTFFFVAAANFFRTPERLILLANVLTLFGVLVAAFALIQYSAWDGRFYWLRATQYSVFGPFVNHNHFAGYMAMLVPLPLAMILRVVRGQAQLLYGFAAALMGTAATVSGSRSGTIGLAAGLVLMAVLNKRCIPGAVRGSQARQRAAIVYDSAVIDRAYSDAREPKRFSVARVGPLVLVVLGIIAGVLWIGAAPIVERFGGGVDQLVRTGTPDPSRADIWRTTIRMVRDHPLFGTGLGTYHTVYPSYADSDKLFGLDYAHNDYLQAVADGGAVGGILVVWFIVATFWSIRHGIHARDALLAGLTLAAAAGIFAVLIQSLSDTDVQIPSNADRKSTRLN